MLKKIGEETCGGDVCLLCTANCPSCGSNDISIRFSPIYEATRKNSENEINIVLKDECMLIECSQCGGRYGRTTEDQDKHPSIENLHKLFIKYLNLPSDAAVKSTIQKDEIHKTVVTLIYPQIE